MMKFTIDEIKLKNKTCYKMLVEFDQPTMIDECLAEFKMLADWLTENCGQGGVLGKTQGEEAWFYGIEVKENREANLNIELKGDDFVFKPRWTDRERPWTQSIKVHLGFFDMNDAVAFKLRWL